MKTKTLILAALLACSPAIQAQVPPPQAPRPSSEYVSPVTTRAYVSTDAKGNTVYGTYTQNMGPNGVGTGYIKSGDGKIYDVSITAGITTIKER